MNVGIRTDASDRIGSGHFMRCLTLAKGLAKKGCRIAFYCQNLPPYLEMKTRDCGFPVIRLRNFNSVEIINETDDARLMGQALHGLAPDLLIVDHYSLGRDWEKQFAKTTSRVLVIDDLANRPHDCDILIDQTLNRTIEEYSSLVAARCRVLAGTDYAILRDEFIINRNASLKNRQKYELNKILVSLGATNVDGKLPGIVERLNHVFAETDVEIKIVVGAMAADSIGTCSQRKTDQTNISFISHIDDMAGELIDTDLAIGAAGTSTWERCCMGVPSYLFVIADNQIEIATEMARAGAAILVRNTDDLFTGPMEPHHPELAAKLKNMSESSAALVDGKGVGRLVNTLLDCID